MSKQETKISGWGVVNEQGAEIWDAKPIFVTQPTLVQKIKLLFYPKRFVLFREINKHRKRIGNRPLRILDVGCGTGASMIDMKQLWGDRVRVYGIEVVNMQVQMAKVQGMEHDMQLHVQHYDGKHFPFEDEYFDVVYSSDVLGHVEDVDSWLSEISRVTNSGGLLAMFSESQLGKHAWIRKYLLDRGVNTDPHAQFHISLFHKQELIEKIERVNFDITQMYSTLWAKFLIHPDELYPALQSQKKFFFLKKINAGLYWLKKKMHPLSTAICELYSLIEMLTLGRYVESQGYVIVAKKK